MILIGMKMNLWPGNITKNCFNCNMVYMNYSNGVPGVPCILLKGKSKQCNLLISNSVKQAVYNSACKSPSLILIHCDNLVPVICNFRQVQSFRKVNKIEDIFLEAASTKAYCLCKQIFITWNGMFSKNIL